MQFESAALTDIGKVRQENEDRYLHDPQRGLFAVADGIGGLPGGAEAAQSAVNSVVTAADHSTRPDEILDLFHAANQAVIALGQQISPDYGIGTTLCLGRIVENTLHLGNLGDSRCYRLRSGQLECLTEDDSVENDVKRRQALGESIQLQESQRHALTQCIGQPMPLDLTPAQHPIQPGDLFLFATDGITRAISEAELITHLSTARPVANTMRALITLASTRGGRDNATGVILRTVD